MGRKVRVHELAKELGVTSKEILTRLNADGQFVKSASSMLEAAVARRVRESIGTVARRNTAAPAGDRQRASEAACRSTPRREKQPAAKPHRTSKLTSADAFDLYKRYRLLSAAENASEAIGGLFREFEQRFGLTRKVVRDVVTSEKLGKRLAHEERRAAIRDSALHKRQRSAPGARSPVKAPRGTDGVNKRPRDRITGLPQLAAKIDPAAVAGIVDKVEGNLDQQEIVTRLQQLVPDDHDRYGYLTWRYAAARLTPQTQPGTLSLHEDIVTVAVVLDQEKQRLDGLIRAHGPILEQPRLAKRGIDNEFRELIDNDDIGRSAADELRRTRAAFDFLRRAVVLTIACPEHDRRLWDILERLQPPPVERLVETSPQLERAIRRLTNFISAIERLLATDEADLAEFYRISRTHLNAVQERRYDFLRPFRAATTGIGPSAREATTDVAFQILPQGEQLRAFLGEIRASKTYNGHRVDEHRLTVLEDLQTHFGADQCTWHHGRESSDGIDNQYLVLAIRSINGAGENAVAISPLAGRHATYVVRHDYAEADWRTLFAHPKFEARLRGARKLLFTTTDSHVDQYRAMYNKIIKLLECHPRDFPQGPADGRKPAPPPNGKRRTLRNFWR